jgi:hypothetical protein
MHSFSRYVMSIAVSLACGTTYAQSVIDIGVTANDVAWNAQTQQLYAAVPSAAGISYGNRLVEISPIDGAILRSVFIGSEPMTIGMSPDAAVAYVGLNGAPTVYPVDLTTMTVGTAIPLGNTMFDGPRFAAQIAVAAGSPGTIAVSRRNHGFSPNYEGIAIYDDGVMRPDVDNGFDGGNSIAFGSTPSVLYGFDNEDSDNKLERFSVSESGVALQSSVDNVMHGGPRIVAEGDTLYGTSGEVVDGTTLQLVNQYTIPGGGFSNVVVLDDSTASTIFVSNSVVNTFDHSTYIPVKSFSVSAFGTPTGATACGRPACIAVAYGANNDLLVVQDVRDIFESDFE